MSEVIVVALLSLVGTLVGSWAGIRQSNKLVNFRFEQLEKTVEKHNQVVERTIKNERDIKTLFNNVEKIEEKIA